MSLDTSYFSVVILKVFGDLSPQVIDQVPTKAGNFRHLMFMELNTLQRIERWGTIPKENALKVVRRNDGNREYDKNMGKMEARIGFTTNSRWADLALHKLLIDKAIIALQ